jgi:hypothetical protein
MKTTLAALALAALPGLAAAQSIPLVFHTDDPAMAAAMGEVIARTGRRNGAGGGPGAHVGQAGTGHSAGIGQTGPNNQAVIVQQGCGHNATAVQTGGGLNTGIFQFGCGASDVHVTQTGSGQATVVVHWTDPSNRRDNPLRGRR